MSIVPLVKVTAYGLLKEKERVLEDLQEIGCLHILPLQAAAEESEAYRPSPQVREALEFLLRAPQRRRQIHNPAKFSAGEVKRQALKVKGSMQALEDERDFLKRRIRDLEPWGEFSFPPREELGQQRLWFYIVPHYLLPKLAETELVWQVVHRTNRFSYVVVLSEGVPQGVPAERTRTGSKPLSQLRERLEEVESELEDLQVERWRLTCWIDLYAGSVDRLEERSARALAADETLDQDPLFALQAWAPRKSVPELREYCERRGLALLVSDPEPDDEPPTLLRNPPVLAGGESLVSFYTTPGYRLWDPSIVVYVSFAIFFAMILSDAGYAVLLGVPLLWFWRKLSAKPTLRGLRNLWLSLMVSSLGWGILVGSYFGVSPAPDSVLGTLKVLDVNDSDTMMRLSILIGLLHVALANAIEAWRLRGSWEACSKVGWLVAVFGAGFWGLANGTPLAELAARLGPWIMGAGGVAVLLFTGTAGNPLRRLLDGVLALPRVTNAFGDVLSYLRLFALGLASASLATAFNGLATQVSEDIVGFGKLLALMVLVFGHALNFLLAIVSGFVHGLRLNFIEFFNWGMPEEGFPFRAFAKKEAVKWSQ